MSAGRTATTQLVRPVRVGRETAAAAAAVGESRAIDLEKSRRQEQIRRDRREVDDVNEHEHEHDCRAVKVEFEREKNSHDESRSLLCERVGCHQIRTTTTTTTIGDEQLRSGERETNGQLVSVSESTKLESERDRAAEVDSKLASETTNANDACERGATKLTPSERASLRAERGDFVQSTAGGQAAAAEAAAEGKDEQEQKKRTSASTTTTTKRVGLLEALLGERGRNWFESKTVILDIQNGRKKSSNGASEANTLERTESYKKLESDGSGAKRREDEDGKQSNSKTALGAQAETRKYSRLPTFGSIPQKLSGSRHHQPAPYFVYHGQARNIEITRPHDRAQDTSAADGKQTFRYHNKSSDIDRNSLTSGRLSGNLSNSSTGTTASSRSGSSSSRSSAGFTTSSSGSSVLLATSASNSTRPPQVSLNKAQQVHQRGTSGGGGTAANNISQQQAKQRTVTGGRKPSSLLGFSNISNLFPGRPVAKTRQRVAAGTAQAAASAAATRTVRTSTSLLDLASDKQAFARQQRQLDKFLFGGLPAAAAGSQQRSASATAAPARAQQQALVELNRRRHHQRVAQQQRAQITPNQGPASAMLRQRASGLGSSSSTQQLSQSQSALAGQQHKSASASYNSQAAAIGRQQQQRHRPASVTGNYLNGNRAQAAASYRLGSAGMSPLVDPDCPVHGDNMAPPPMNSLNQRGRSHERYHDDHYERARYADIGAGGPQTRHSAGYYSSSQPDLLYGSAGGGGVGGGGLNSSDAILLHDDPYNIARSARDYPAYGGAGRKSPIYSPLSPIDYEPPYDPRASSRGGYDRTTRNSAHQQHQQPAYYNSSSRFSLYQPDGRGNVRSALAPTSEQLRRILGYKPPGPLVKPVHLHPQWAYTRPFIHLQPAGSGFGRSPSPNGLDGADSPEVPRFAPFNRLQDNQAIRAVDFHPSGEVYAIGSNSRALRICAYPAEHELRHFDPFDGDDDLLGAGAGDVGGATNGDRQTHEQSFVAHAKPPRVLFKFLQVHRGSIYCVSFNPSGQLLATGSNDQTIHIVKYNSITHNPDGEEFRLTMHNGTIRDLCFIDDSSGNGSSLLLSAGGGDNKIYVTDCDTITPFQSMAGHTQMVMALNHCGGAQFVSGSYDRTIRFWDLRSRSCTSIVSAPPSTSASNSQGGAERGAGLTSGPGAPVCALRVDPSGRLLATGHTDTTCMLYDIRGGKIIQTFRPHDDEIRAISFSPKSYYLLTGGYDGRLVVSDLQGDLTQPLPSACVAESQDKIVQAKWHPADFTFVSTSADKSATLWSLPGEIRN